MFDLTCCSPGTLFTASSMGRVIMTIIWSMGITPLSTAIRMRGKLVVGKTATGMVNARYTPKHRQRDYQKYERLGVARKPVRLFQRVPLATPFGRLLAGLVASAVVILLLSGRP